MLLSSLIFLKSLKEKISLINKISLILDKTNLRAYGDYRYLHIYSFGQSRYLNGFPGRKIAGEIAAVYFIYLGKCFHICKKNGGLYHVLETQAGGCKDGLQVFHYLVGFINNTGFNQFAGNGVQGYLTGYI